MVYVVHENNLEFTVLWHENARQSRRSHNIVSVEVHITTFDRKTANITDIFMKNFETLYRTDQEDGSWRLRHNNELYQINKEISNWIL